MSEFKTNSFQVPCLQFRADRSEQIPSGEINAMEQQTLPTSATTSAVFPDRRRNSGAESPPGVERRQFRDGSHSGRPEVAELAAAVDDYKIAHRRRFITFEELFGLMTSLGYHR